MNAPSQQQPIRRVPLFTPYVVIWSMLGALSFGFLMVLGLAPQWLDDLRPTIGLLDVENSNGQRVAARLAADLNHLKDNIEQVRLDLSKIKTDVDVQGTQQKAMTAQVAALETRLAQALQSASVETSSPRPGGQPAVGDQSGSSDAVKSPVRTLKVINADSTIRGAALETGSVGTASVGTAPPTQKTVKTIAVPSAAGGDAATAKATADKAIVNNALAAATSFDTTVVTPAEQALGVKISTGASVDSLRLSWSLLADKHGDTLKSLEARYHASGDPSNQTYDLVAGPLNTRADAARVCKTLIQRGVPCTVGSFAGNAL